jgi:hypothetical protein
MTVGSGGLSLEILPLTPGRFGDVATLFDEGGDPKWCWYKWQVGNCPTPPKLPCRASDHRGSASLHAPGVRR